MSADLVENGQVLLTTSPILEEYSIREQKGVVLANVTLARNAGQDILANIRDFFGGRSQSWENTLHTAQREALEELSSKAQERGANAVIGIEIQDESITKGIKNVKATGTAVII